VFFQWIKQKGVCWDKNNYKWLAQIGPEGKHYFLGRFIDPLKGAKAYDAQSIILHGEFVCTNKSMGLY
jgi:hypothetical protein